MKYFLHNLCFIKPDEPVYSVTVVESDYPPENHELGVVFPMDRYNASVWSINGDIQQDIIPMLKACRNNLQKYN